MAFPKDNFLDFQHALPSWKQTTNVKIFLRHGHCHYHLPFHKMRLLSELNYSSHCCVHIPSLCGDDLIWITWYVVYWSLHTVNQVRYGRKVNPTICTAYFIWPAVSIVLFWKLFLVFIIWNRKPAVVSIVLFWKLFLVFSFEIESMLKLLSDFHSDDKIRKLAADNGLDRK